MRSHLKYGKNISKANKKLNLRQQAVFFSLLGDMLQAGFSLKKSLESINLMDLKNSRAINTIVSELETGTDFSTALKPWVKPSTYAQVKIAEQHGSLVQSLKQLGRFLVQINEQTAKIKGLLLYPCMLLILLGGLFVSLKVWLFPRLQEFSELSNVQTTAVGIEWHQVIHWIIIGLFALGTLYLWKVFYWWIRQVSLSRHVWYAQLPILGRVYRLYTAYVITFNLSLLFKSGMDLPQICHFLHDFKPQTIYFQLGIELRNFLDNGQELRNFIRKYPLLPNELVFFLSSGDTKEQLGDELLIFAENSYQRLMRATDHILTWIQPLLFLVIAGIIIGMYLAILLPIYASIGGLYK